MIGPGSWRFVPSSRTRARLRSPVLWRTRAYTRKRRRVNTEAARTRSPVDTEDMLFDRGMELPQATIRRAPRAWGDILAGDFKRWVLSRWSWLRPRTVPVVVAFVGMLGMLQAVEYLSSAGDAPAAIAGDAATPYVDGEPAPAGHQVRLVGAD